jgi:polar amino acid transport system substrate-binding protein
MACLARVLIFAALGMACFPLDRAKAQEPAFFNEAKPMFSDCGDGSYDRAVKDGITLGIGVSPPKVWQDQASNEPRGVDWEIQKAVLDWMGVKTIHLEWMPFTSQIPSLLSKRTDVIAVDINITPEREKVISFTGPAWWYGPVIVTTKGNPLHIQSYADLKGKKIGALAGSAPDSYLSHIGVTTTPFTNHFEQLQSLNEGRLDALLDDDVVFADFVKKTPGAKIEALWDIGIPKDILQGRGYGYARFGVRKEDCSLRAAYTQGLAEIRGNGHLSFILKKYGMSDRNLWMPWPDLK